MNISIIVTSYNYDKYIERCIRSLINQDISRSKYEIIVIDDHSQDHTIEILDNYKNEIRLYKNRKNMGLPYTANRGIKLAKGQYIVRVDADDFVNNTFLYMLYTAIEIEAEFHAIACDYYTADRFGNKLKRIPHQHYPIACGIMYRKDALFDIGLYNEEMLLREDEELRMRYSKKYKVLYLPVALYRYRDHGVNLTKDSGKMDYYAKKLKENNGG